jgi:hypothetical protein
MMIYLTEEQASSIRNDILDNGKINVVINKNGKTEYLPFWQAAALVKEGYAHFKGTVDEIAYIKQIINEKFEFKFLL